VSVSYTYRADREGAILATRDKMAADDEEKKWWTSESAIPIETPSCLYIAGSSQSGKSFFVRRLIKERNGIFAKKQKKIVYCFNILELELSDMAAQDSAILLHEGLPDKLLIDEWSLDGDWVLILDDAYLILCLMLLKAK
jgi:hypothetical protein